MAHDPRRSARHFAPNDAPVLPRSQVVSDVVAAVQAANDATYRKEHPGLFRGPHGGHR